MSADADKKAKVGGKNGTPSDMTSAEFYFDTNSHFGTHEELLKDRMRTVAFKKATMGNAHLFKDKIVLDIGTGTGILAMFAAKAGAEHVYAVESSGIAHVAKAIVKANKLDKKITIIKGKMEDIKLPVEKVDVIVCDWMGYMLIQDSMIATVIDARDRYLKTGGKIFPDSATLRICGIEDAEYKEQRIEFWDNVYGFNMSCMKENSMSEPLIDMCRPEQILTNFATIHKLDMYTVKAADLTITSKFSLKSSGHDFCHALVLFFEVDFTHCHKTVKISTNPRHKYTHWKQTVLYLDEPVPMCQGEVLNGSVWMKNEGTEKKKTVIKLSSSFKGRNASTKQSRTYVYN